MSADEVAMAILKEMRMFNYNLCKHTEQMARLNDNIEAEKAVKEETWRPTDYRED